MVGFWATLSMNIPDFSRLRESQRDQVSARRFGLRDDGALCLHRPSRGDVGQHAIYVAAILETVEVLKHSHSVRDGGRVLGVDRHAGHEIAAERVRGRMILSSSRRRNLLPHRD